MDATKVQLALAIASAAAQPDWARARLEMALAEARDTGICFYHAELLRLRAQADIDAARELGRRRRTGTAALEVHRAAPADVDRPGTVTVTVKQSCPGTAQQS